MPRNKMKWATDPQNTNWSKDENNFGFKMLEKMGWKKGTAIGLDQNGLVEPIKTGKNRENRGIGYNISYDDTWLDHQEEFSSLLSQLNSSQNKSDSNTTEVIGLEKISKHQKRIHYKKFARGKDLTNYNTADMVGIFGLKRPHSVPSTPLSLSDNEKSDVEDSLNASEIKKFKVNSDICKSSKLYEGGNKTDLSNLKVSQYSSNEYFERRLKENKSGKNIKSAVAVASVDNVAIEEKTQEHLNTIIPENNAKQHSAKIKKQKKSKNVSELDNVEKNKRSKKKKKQN